MTREEKEQTGKYVLQMARLLEDGCYQQEMLLKAVHIIDEALEQELILNKIRAEIGQLPTTLIDVQRPHSVVERDVVELGSVIRILDKYKAESEG